MSILPEKQAEYGGTYADVQIAIGYNMALRDCQSALDAAIEKAADEMKIANLITLHYMINDEDMTINADMLAHAISAHIRQSFDKEGK